MDQTTEWRLSRFHLSCDFSQYWLQIPSTRTTLEANDSISQIYTVNVWLRRLIFVLIRGHKCINMPITFLACKISDINDFQMAKDQRRNVNIFEFSIINKGREIGKRISTAFKTSYFSVVFPFGLHILCLLKHKSLCLVLVILMLCLIKIYSYK